MKKYVEMITLLILLLTSCNKSGTNTQTDTSDTAKNCQTWIKTEKIVTDIFKWDGFTIDETDKDIDSVFFIKFLSGLGFDFTRWKEGSQTIYRSTLTPTLKEYDCLIVIKCINRIDYPVNSLFLMALNGKPKIVTLAGISVYPEGYTLLSSEIINGEIIRQTKISRSHQYKIFASTTFDIRTEILLH